MYELYVYIHIYFYTYICAYISIPIHVYTPVIKINLFVDIYA